MFTSLFDRFFLSADVGSEGGGGGSAAAATAAPGGEGEPATTVGTAAGGASPFDYEGFAKQYGGPEGLQQMARFANDIQSRAHYNPQFKETLERALKGEYGAAAQQQAQQQQAQQQQQPQSQPRFQYEPATLAQMQTFHSLLDQARNSGDPQAVKDVWDNPAHAKAKESYLQHQNAMNDAYWNPRDHQKQMWNDEEMKQMRQQEYQQAIQQAVAPLQQAFAMHQKTSFYMQNQKAIDSLPQHIKEAFGRGVFGPIESGNEWIAAAQKAIQEAQRMAQTGQQPPATQIARNETNTTERVMSTGRPANTNTTSSQPKKSAAREYAEKMAKDRLADKS